VHDEKKNCNRNFNLSVRVLFTEAESQEMNKLVREREKGSDSISQIFFQLNTCGSGRLVALAEAWL
jgi:hypothetical protein